MLILMLISLLSLLAHKHYAHVYGYASVRCKQEPSLNHSINIFVVRNVYKRNIPLCFNFGSIVAIYLGVILTVTCKV